MLSKISHFVAIATLTTLTCVITHPSQAQTPDSESSPTEEIVENRVLNMNELINRAFFQNSGDFFEQASMSGQLNTIFGWRDFPAGDSRIGDFPQGSFPENNITRDALLLNAILADYFKQSQEREPTIRTKDLPSPFSCSVADPDCLR